MSILVNQIKRNLISRCSFAYLSSVLSCLESEFGKGLKIKFTSSLELKFHNYDVEKVKIIKHEGRILELEVITNFLGIVGPSGVLPLHYTEYIHECIKNKDNSLSDFINIFYNRFIHLFRDIVESGRSNIRNITEEVHTRKDASLSSEISLIQSLIGIAPAKVLKLIPYSLSYYATLLSVPQKSEDLIKKILSGLFGCTVKIEQFITQKIALKPSELSVLGQRNSILGSNLYLGEYAYFSQNKILIKVLEMNLSSYNNFFLNHNFRLEVENVIKFCIGNHVDYEILLFVRDSEKRTRIKVSDPRALGINFWSKS